MPLNLLAKTPGPSLARARPNSAVSEAKFAMLRTAADIAARGPAALAESDDPFGDGPFGMTPTPGGYLLQSALTDKDTPVTLRVGAAD